MKALSDTLYHEVATFSATVDAEIGDCLQRKVDELTDIIAAIAVQVDPARGPEGGTASTQLPQRAEIARQANERLDRLEASLQECDRVAQARQGSTESILPGGQRKGEESASEFRRLRDLFADTVAAIRNQLGP